MIVSPRDKKEEDGSTYSNLDKTSVLQEARIFNDSQLNPKKCVQTLTKILAIISQGHKLGKTEATETFFAMTRLFQCKDHNVRRLVYLVIKELSTIADDVIIVTSSLTKDMTGPEISFQGPAIRALCTVTDATMIQSIERYLKQAIVDKSATISSAVLSSAYKFMRMHPDVVKRWANEIQEAASSSRIMVQYLAFGLLYHIRMKDRLSVTKLLQKNTKSNLKSPLACCLMIRVVAKQLEEEGLNNNSLLLKFLESSLQQKSEMVMYEAARAIINLPHAFAQDIAPAVSFLQFLCSSPKPTLRYAAVKTLNSIATNHPEGITACTIELEHLIADSNRCIAALAITTLLKTRNESNVERLLKHVCPYMAEITDEFRTLVLESIRTLATKYPKKYSVLLNFLSGLLRDSGGYTFKKAVISVIESIIMLIPEAKSIGLLQLCEFIEDCEHVKLTQRILYLLGREGPSVKRPRQFTRYIYNRVILEAAPIKCTATTALARFAAQNKEMLPSILVLLKRIMLDEDDEVRDRAAFYHYLLSSPQADQLKSVYLLCDEMHLSPSGLERALLDYMHDSHAPAKAPFSLATVPVAAPTTTTVGAVDVTRRPDANAESVDTMVIRAGDTTERKTVPQYADQLAAVPQLSNLGPLFKSSEPVELSEADTEYAVTCVKHIFPKHMVLQYKCINTMADLRLENVFVHAEPDEPDFLVLQSVPCSQLEYNTPGYTYVLVQLPEKFDLLSSTFTNMLKFTVKEANSDAEDPGLADEYQLEDLTVDIADHVQRVNKGNFSLAWQELDESSQVEETYVLTKHKTIKDTITQVVNHLGLQPCERTDHMPQETRSSHLLLLAGVFRGGHEVLARCKLARVEPDGASVSSGITLQIIVRSSDSDISQAVADSIGQ